MEWRCKFCGFEIKNREDRRKVEVKDGKIYLIGYCDNCYNWTILKMIETEDMRSHVHKKIEKE